MNSTAWYSNIARVIAIFVAVGLYAIGLLAFVRKRKKPNFISSDNERQSPLPSYEGPERRIYQRARLNVVVRYKLAGIKGAVHVFKEGRIKDVSEGGLLLVEAHEKFEVGNILECKFRLPGVDHYILLRGNVAWAKATEQSDWFNYGISIVQIDPNDRKYIAKYVASQQAVSTSDAQTQNEKQKEDNTSK